ncbi:SDR family oxidoreductase [Patescibacteria group bacterium]|nr:SDR family oxidoreductase [Patescibacteria group bacterium]
MNCLVTGGAGFIGSHLVDRLLSDGHEVTVIDNFSTGRPENLAGKKVEIIKRSICDNLDQIFENEKFEVVFHLAAIPRVQLSINDPVNTHETNINGTFNLLLTCRKFNVKRFVFSSSSSVYGDQDRLPLVETMTPNPSSPYALHKLVGEHYCRLFRELYGLETISLRYFNVYGPRQNPDGGYANLIPKFFRMLKDGNSPVINGTGKQTRDFTYVGDVVEANLLAANTTNPDCFGQTFNVGAGKNYSVNEVAEIIIKLTGSKSKVSYGPKVVEPQNTLADISKSTKLLGWSPKTNFTEGMKIVFRTLK